MPKSKLSDEQLRQFGKSWFTEACRTSEQDESDLREWNKERRKWTADYESGGFSAAAWTLADAEAVATIEIYVHCSR